MLTGPIMEYEKILCGSRLDFSSSYINLSADPNIIREVLRYVVEELLCWSPDEMADKFNNETIKKLHLDSVARKVKFPNDLDRDKHTFYYADFVYPGTCLEKRKKAALEYYVSRVINSKAFKWKWFPSEKENDIYLFNFLEYALAHNPYGTDPKIPSALYKLFGFRRRVDAFLKDFGLFELCLRQYPYPIEMLHDYLTYKGMDTEPSLYLYYRCYYFFADEQIAFTN